MADREGPLAVPILHHQEDFVSYQPRDGLPWLRVSLAVARTAELPLPPAGLKACDDRTAERMKFVFTAFVGLCSLFTSGGLIYGWGPLQNRWRREEGFQSMLCRGPHDLCVGEQQTFMQFTFCAAMMFGVTGGMIFAAALLDIIGPRWTAVLGLLISLGGNLTMAFARWEAHWMFLPALTLITFGGMCPFLAAHHVVNFWREKYTILCAMMVCFDSSGFVYVLLQYVRWINRAQWFCFFAGLCGLFIVGCMYLLPDVPSQIGEQCVLPSLWGLPFFRPSRADNSDSTWGSPDREPSDSSRDMPIAPIQVEREKCLCLEDCLNSPHYQWLVLHFCACHCAMTWLGGALPDLLAQVGDPDYFTTTLYPLVTNSSFLFLPYVAQTLEESGFGYVMAYALASIQATIALCLVPRLWPQMLTLMAFAMAKGFVYAGFFTFLALNFPIQHYGPLVSIALSRALAVGVLLFPLIYLQQQVFHSNYVPFMLGTLLAFLPFYRFPYLLHQQALQHASRPTVASWSSSPPGCSPLPSLYRCTS
eukprot:GGOE01037447.1.p1 GENE.GGOE01037447.1~~GGOE01037447.1.p1  ORF type:complete len:540 (+),score=155.66 GGOE01037447.1:22-1620(+)